MLKFLKRAEIRILLLVIVLSACRAKDHGDLSQNATNIKYLHSTFCESELTVANYIIDKSTLKIVTFGHIYDLLVYPEILDAFVAAIVKENPDYVFVLGDIVFDNTPEEWDLILKQFDKIDCPIYYVPGNHDINYHTERWYGDHTNQWKAETNYLERVGYRYKVIEDNLANYLILNLNDSLPRIESYLDKMEAKIDSTKPTFVFTHQNAWNGDFANENPKSWPDKPMKSEDLLEHLMSFDVLIDGDWNGTFEQLDRTFFGKSFVTICAGNKTRGNQFFITSLEFADDKVTAKPAYIDIPSESTWFAGVDK